MKAFVITALARSGSRELGQGRVGVHADHALDTSPYGEELPPRRVEHLRWVSPWKMRFRLTSKTDLA